MSLINKMLQDLETRDRSAGAPTRVVLDDLRPVRNTPAASRAPRLLLILLPFVVVAGVGIYYFLGPSTTPQASFTATPTKVEPVTPQQAVRLERREETAPTGEEKIASIPVAPAAIPAPAPPAVAATPSTQEEPVAAVEKPTPPPKPVVSAARPRVAPAQKPKPVPEAKPVADSSKVVIEKNERPITPYEQAEQHYRKAAQLMSQGRGEQARSELTAALSIHPSHHAARELAAALAMQNGRWHEAEVLLAQGIGLAPTRLSFAQLLARAHLEQGEESQAIATLEGARTAAAGDHGYLSFLAALYQRAGRHADAVGAYRGAIEARAQDARAWLGLGISLEATQDADAASQAYTRAVQLGGLDNKLVQYAQQRLAALGK